MLFVLGFGCFIRVCGRSYLVSLPSINEYRVKHFACINELWEY